MQERYVNITEDVASNTAWFESAQSLLTESREQFRTLPQETRKAFLDMLQNFVNSERQQITREQLQVIVDSLAPSDFRDETTQFFATRRVNGLIDLSGIDYRSLTPPLKERYRIYVAWLNRDETHGEMKNSLEHLCLPSRIHNTLLRNKIRTISQVRELGTEDLPKLRNMGLLSAVMVKRALEEFDELRRQAEENTSN